MTIVAVVRIHCGIVSAGTASGLAEQLRTTYSAPSGRSRMPIEFAANGIAFARASASMSLMNHRASIRTDFVFDHTTTGSQLQRLSIVDEHTRECLALKVGRNITSEDVIDTLAELFAMRGVPQCVRSDNGPEFVAHAIRRWLAQVDVETRYIEAGSPWQNGYAESFHSRLRDEFLALEVFESLSAAKRLTRQWQEDYNHRRPHSSLGYVTPIEFAARCAASAPVSDTPRPALQRYSGDYLTHPS